MYSNLGYTVSFALYSFGQNYSLESYLRTVFPWLVVDYVTLLPVIRKVWGIDKDTVILCLCHRVSLGENNNGLLLCHREIFEEQLATLPSLSLGKLRGKEKWQHCKGMAIKPIPPRFPFPPTLLPTFPTLKRLRAWGKGHEKDTKHWYFSAEATVCHRFYRWTRH